jgi:hypothetical protein
LALSQQNHHTGDAVFIPHATHQSYQIKKSLLHIDEQKQVTFFLVVIVSNYEHTVLPPLLLAAYIRATLAVLSM